MIASRFTIERRLGRGGCAFVFLAVDSQSSRHCALKVARYSSTIGTLMLEKEGQILTTLKHPNASRLIAHDWIDASHRYVATEWIDGSSADEMVRSDSTMWSAVATVAAAVAGALGALHELSWLHRDVKPTNIMIPWTAGTARFSEATLIDFSHAARLTEDVSGAERTRFGQFGGTVWYMAPEQLAGRKQLRATDVFALGATMYHLLYGRSPMSETPLERLVKGPETPDLFTGPFVLRRLSEDVELPTEPPVPLGLRALLSAMLRCAPEQRPSRLSQVRDDLLELVDCFAETPALSPPTVRT